jgi:hypothetical protein
MPALDSVPQNFAFLLDKRFWNLQSRLKMNEQKSWTVAYGQVGRYTFHLQR